MGLVEQYLTEIYSDFLLYVVIGYALGWITAVILTRPALNLVTVGNPYKKICNCWLGIWIAHTIAVVGFTIYTCKMMIDNGREPAEIILYNTGFIICLLINIFMLGRLARRKSAIQF